MLSTKKSVAEEKKQKIKLAKSTMIAKFQSLQVNKGMVDVATLTLGS